MYTALCEMACGAGDSRQARVMRDIMIYCINEAVQSQCRFQYPVVVEGNAMGHATSRLQG